MPLHDDENQILDPLLVFLFLDSLFVFYCRYMHKEMIEDLILIRPVWGVFLSIVNIHIRNKTHLFHCGLQFSHRLFLPQKYPFMPTRKEKHDSLYPVPQFNVWWLNTLQRDIKLIVKMLDYLIRSQVLKADAWIECWMECNRNNLDVLSSLTISSMSLNVFCNTVKIIHLHN